MGLATYIISTVFYKFFVAKIQFFYYIAHM